MDKKYQTEYLESIALGTTQLLEVEVEHGTDTSSHLLLGVGGMNSTVHMRKRHTVQTDLDTQLCMSVYNMYRDEGYIIYYMYTHALTERSCNWACTCIYA